MAQSKQVIKSRIESVESTKKITNAMQLVASSKLNKYRRQLAANQEYASGMVELLSSMMKAAQSEGEFPAPDRNLPAMLIVITSDMGLCGAYNANVYKLLKTVYKPDDKLFMIGSRGIGWCHARHIPMEGSLADLNEDTAYIELSALIDKGLEMIRKKEIGRIEVLYTHYKNTLTFEPEIQMLYPPENKKEHKKSTASAATLYEPSAEEMLEQMAPMIAKQILYSRYMASKTSEHASRRLAMENATDNAQELMDDLNLEYNRIRQGAITQEITEIVSGANALK